MKLEKLREMSEEALTGLEALHYVDRERQLLAEVAALLKTRPEDAPEQLRRRLEAQVRDDASVQELLDEVVARRLDPASAAVRLLEREVGEG